MSESVTYRGVRPSDGAGAAIIEILDETDTVIGVVNHVSRHSPAGMNWGYGGSGAADCARSLLIAALGDEARCPACNGEGRVYLLPRGTGWNPPPHWVPLSSAPQPPDPERVSTCLESCDGGYRSLPYQRFKWQFVGRWGDTWTMGRDEILAWWTSQGAESGT